SSAVLRDAERDGLAGNVYGTAFDSRGAGAGGVLVDIDRLVEEPCAARDEPDSVDIHLNRADADLARGITRQRRDDRLLGSGVGVAQPVLAGERRGCGNRPELQLQLADLVLDLALVDTFPGGGGQLRLDLVEHVLC